MRYNTATGLKDFILRGNVVDLCVAVVLGAAFTELINAFVSSFITPLLGIIGDSNKANALTFTINGSVFTYGAFINAALSFIIICLVVYFLVVVPLLKFMHQLMPTRTCPKCMSFDVPCEASVCKVCGSDIPAIFKKGKTKTVEDDEEIFQDPLDRDLEMGYED
jgi:large conductance mechanosensitive channel